MKERAFQISDEMHYVSLFFLNERNVTTSLLMLILYWAVAHYANLSSSSINNITTHIHKIFSQRYCMKWVPGDPQKKMPN